MTKQELSHLISVLRGLYNGDDEDYRAFFDAVAKRKRRLWTMDVESIRLTLVNQTRAAAIEVAKELEAIGVGRFIIGRRGAQTRVEWNFQMDSVGEVARNEHDNLIAAVISEDDRPDEDRNEGTSPTDYITYSLPLRRDRKVSFALPDDLTEKEACRLSDFIKSLPID